MARALASETKLLLLDMPYEDRAAVSEDKIEQPLRLTKAQGISMILARLNAVCVLALAGPAIFLDTATVMFDDCAAEVLEIEAPREEYLAM